MASTIDQVAIKAGVSKATVSRVLNNSKPVSAETRRRVLQAIEELDFRPNPIARSLVSKKSGIIGVVVTDIANLFVSVLVKGIEEIAYSNDYNILICNSLGSMHNEIGLLKMLKNKRVDGIIFLTSQLHAEHKTFFQHAPMPIALVNVRHDEQNLISVHIDNRKAAYDITSFFLQRGHTAVGMIRTSLEDQFTGFERFAGYRQALQDYGVAYDERLVKEASLEAQEGYRVIGEMLHEKLKITALVVACDLLAFGVVKGLLDHGVRVPEDIDVAGFDDVPMASFYNPPLTTVRQPILQMGRSASEMLIKQARGEKIEPKEVVFPHEIIVRKSTRSLLHLTPAGN